MYLSVVHACGLLAVSEPLLSETEWMLLSFLIYYDSKKKKKENDWEQA